MVCIYTSSPCLFEEHVHIGRVTVCMCVQRGSIMTVCVCVERRVMTVCVCVERRHHDSVCVCREEAS